MSDREDAGTPTVTVHGDTFRLTWPSSQIEAEVERFSEHRDELSAEVTIRSARPPAPGLLHSARLNLMSTQTRKTLAAALADREPDLDWVGLVEVLCFVVRERYRAGNPTIDLRTYQRVRDDRRFVEPFIDHGGPTTIAAHGGSGKTTIAIAIGLTAAGVPVLGQLHGDPVPVLFCDWETDPDATQATLDAALAGVGRIERPPIYYRRMVASLPESAAALRREIARLGIGLFIGDSIGMARGGEPESADMTLRLFAAARALDVPVLFTDHVTNAEAGDVAKKPFGSAYTWNASRLVWTMDKAQEEGQDGLAVTLTNRKRNNGRLLPRVSYRITFQNGPADMAEAVSFQRIDPATEPGLSQKLPLRLRILHELTGGPVAQAALAEALGVPLNAVTARTSEMVRGGDLVRLDDRRVALKARTS